ncbi:MULTISPECIES: NAD-dependent epimerase/dehydratase family protein [Prochlorococcus]|uniref:NAD-dependent epimerase/dehydratase n=1 Tax=Prochlorococcus marinus str. MIT 9116 TaxID=167544 RepID=A0A0A1ZXW6_PROMR|nr:NAD(P)-dependent oxidoreductase [Prochlorococcus marinus]KGF91725.1 NAD-dependent epimerase/dehydratase [Prochlorococcus marinus str. MIT 9107]KGF93089.1 NAD-dependent epimerase/dehydratase [Prochlorococcus marinus str. MIT 9116]KGF95090.1 NAD-dependent epimerase/dehydratase [Prochlorococcus marinus str. MIT 9123]
MLDLKKFSNTNILITGGTGPFGISILKKLDAAKCSFNIFLLSRNKEKVEILKNRFSNLNLFYIESELPFINKSFINKLPKVDYVLHMASVTAKESYENIDPLLKFRLLSEGTLDICNYALKIKAKRLLFTSSGCVYGPNNNNEPLKEDRSLLVSNNTSKNNSLIIGKISAEYICNYFREFSDLDTKIARCFSFCGEGIPVDLHYAIGNFAHQAINNKDIIIKGDGKSIRSYMDLDDLAFWLLNQLLRDFESNIINTGSDETISILELAEKIKFLANSNSKIKVLGEKNVSLSNPQRNFYIPDITRAKKELNLTIKCKLNDSVKKYLNSLYR